MAQKELSSTCNCLEKCGVCILLTQQLHSGKKDLKETSAFVYQKTSSWICISAFFKIPKVEAVERINRGINKEKL